MRNGTADATIPRNRMLVTYATGAVVLVIFLARLVQLQIMQGSSYQAAALENRITETNTAASRGVIYDRNGSQIVRNVPSYNIVVTPALLPDSSAEVDAIFRTLSELTGVPVEGQGPPAAKCIPGRGIRQLVEEGATNKPYSAWPIACDVPEAVARVLREKQVDLPGVSVDAVPIRDYVSGGLTSAIVGYLGPIPASLQDYYEGLGFDASRDKVGYAGIELAFQNLLAGRNGSAELEVDVAGQPLRTLGDVVQPVPGNSLRLTIDARLQAAAEAALQNRIDFINRYAGEVRVPLGVAIAMNPQTGEILAMVSLPTYENNRLARLIPQDYYNQLVTNDRGKPLVNHAISSEFPPGSTFKIVTSVGALQEKVIDPNARVDDPGKITIANRYFPNDPGKAKDFVCWKKDGHGKIAFLDALAFSCNVYFYKVGGGFPGEPIEEGGLGIARLGTYARALGYGAPLGVELPGEEGGLIPTEDWKRINLGESWSVGDTYNSSTGQGYVLGTPLQVLESIATLANGGRVMWPHVLKQVLDGEGNVVQDIEPCTLWDLTDGTITPLDEIGKCISAPDYVTTLLAERSAPTPDISVDSEVIDLVRRGMRRVVTDGTAAEYAQLENISSGGKTGTGEFCDAVAQEQGLCIPGAWPTHAWYGAFAPWENPEIAVIVFVYNGGEGAVTSGPAVRQIMEAYFSLKASDAARQE
jgi:penicillin-binding protein 2